MALDPFERYGGGRQREVPRPARIFLGHGVEAGPPYDFARLMLASKLVTSRLLSEALGREMRVLCHNPSSGLVVFRGTGPNPEGLVVVVVDDESEAPRRVVAWATAAGLLTPEGELLRGFPAHGRSPAGAGHLGVSPPGYVAADATVVIATSDGARAGALRECAPGPVVCVT